MCRRLHLELTHSTDETPVFFLQNEEFTILPYFSGSVAVRRMNSRATGSPIACKGLPPPHVPVFLHDKSAGETLSRAQRVFDLWALFRRDGDRADDHVVQQHAHQHFALAGPTLHRNLSDAQRRDVPELLREPHAARVRHVQTPG